MSRSLAHRRLRARLLACLLAAALAVVAACAVVPPRSSPADTLEMGVPPATSLATSAAAAPTRSVPPGPNRAPSPTPPTSSVPLAATPPAASLSAEGGDPVLGQLGSYAWGDGGSDSPWLPGAPIAVGAGEPLAMTISDGAPVSGWTARRTPAGATSPAGALPAGSGAGTIAFDAPAAGSWTLAVTAEFAGGLGSATWYWRLDVR